MVSKPKLPEKSSTPVARPKKAETPTVSPVIKKDVKVIKPNSPIKKALDKSLEVKGAQALEAKRKTNNRDRHAHCVDEKEYRIKLAKELLEIGTYPNAKSGYEKVVTAQTEYLAKAIIDRSPEY